MASNTVLHVILTPAQQKQFLILALQDKLSKIIGSLDFSTNSTQTPSHVAVKCH